MMKAKIPYEGIDHLGIAVLDLEQATHTYRDVLGFEYLDEEILEERGLKVRFFNSGKERIELLAALRENSEVSTFLQKRGEGLHHVCYKVKDIQAALREIEQQGGKIIGNGVQQGAHGKKVAFVHPKSTHGLLIELVEY